MKRILAILGVMILVFVVGCDTEKSTPMTARTFVGGSDAILLDFEPDSPPPEVYDGGDFPFRVVLRVTNAGEHAIPKDEISFNLEGIPPGDFGVVEADLKGVLITEDELEATYIDSDGNQMPGTTTYVEIPASKDLNFGANLRGNNPWTIRANACYKYSTQAQVDLCVLRDLKRREGKVCVVDEVKAVQSSSSPVLVGNFRENVAGTNKISFSFDISKVGDGKISRAEPAAGQECSTLHTERDKVKVTINTGIDKQLRCSALGAGGTGNAEVSGEVTLYGGKRIITCTQEIAIEGEAGEGDYIKKAYIDVEFYYKDYIEKGILVKHTTEGTS